MFSSIFRRKGIYIAALIISLTVLVGIAAFLFMAPMGGSLPGDGWDRPGNTESMEDSGTGSSQFPAMPEGFGGDGFTPPGNMEGFPAAFIMNLVRDNLPLIIAAAGALLVAVFSLVMLIVLGRRKKLRSMDGEMDDDFPVHKKKSGTGPYILVLAALVALFLALLPEPSTAGSDVQVQEEVVETVVENGNISRTLISTGSISETTAKAVSLAGDIKVEHWYVNAGDYVQEGQVIARIDRDSVILSIAQLTELMSEIDSAINKSFNDVIANSIYAPAPGRVKSIYAQPGVKVQDTIAEHSALMRLSLDGLMAADIEAVSGMQSGMTVNVQLSDGSCVSGRVESIFEGIASVVISDEKAPYGENVSIFHENGSLLGQAPLYIHKEVKISGMAGTVQRLNVEENMLVGTDMALVVLTDTAYSGQRDILTEKRRGMEEELTKLFEVYNSGNIVSPCTGRVAAINQDIVIEQLSYDGAGLSLLADEEPSMKSYAVSVAGIEDKLHVLSYSDGLNQSQIKMDLSEAVVFKYVDGNYIPVSSAQIAVGDSLVLSCYISGGTTNLDHVVLFSAKGGSSGGGGQGRPGGSGNSGGNMGGAATGSGNMSSGNKTGTAQPAGGQTAAQPNTEDPYAVTMTILSYVTPFDKAELDITVDELDISAYRVGQNLSITLDALPGQSFTGTVVCIDPNGANDDGGSTKYTVTVSMPRTENMLSGMNASVRLETERRDDVLTIPLAAVCEEDGRVFVYRSYDAEKDVLGGITEIETGLSDGESVEVVSGLSAGDMIFYRYAEKILYNFQ